LLDKESIYESPPDLVGTSPQDPEFYPPGAEDPVIDGKPAEHAGNVRAKKYSKITDEQRRDFINAVENHGEKIINAAKRFDINYSSAKSILNVFKNEGRSIKKQFRDKSNKNQKYFQEGDESSFGGNAPAKGKQQAGDKIPTTNHASTQTMDDPAEAENSLLALRDRLLASKTDKRQNPYEGLSSHEFTRFSGSLSDYSERQLASDPNNGNHGGGQVFNLGGNSNQNFMSQQNVLRPDSMGYGNVPPNYQFFQQGRGPTMQNSPPIYQQQPQYIQGYQGGQPTPSQFSGSDFSKASNFEGPPRQQEDPNFGSMIYTGVNPVQYFMMNPANDQMRGMQMGQQQQQQQPQYQFLQPILYVMPASQNVPMNQPYLIPQQNNPIIYHQNQNQNNDSGQNQKGGSPNPKFNSPYSNLK